MMPPKIVPRALVSLGIRMTRIAGWTGPVFATAAAAEISFIGVPKSFRTGLTCYPSRSLISGRPRADRQMPETDPVPAQRLPGRPPATAGDAVLLRGVVERRP